MMFLCASKYAYKLALLKVGGNGAVDNQEEECLVQKESTVEVVFMMN